MKLNGKVTIISGYPCIGKTTAAKMSSHIPGMHIIDFDSGDYKKKHPDIPKEKIDIMYVQDIISIYYKMRAELTGSKHPEDESYVILVSCHENVRNMLRENGIDFIVVVPTLESLLKIVGVARARYMISNKEEDKRAFEFLCSPLAKESLEKILSAGNIDNQKSVYAINFGVSMVDGEKSAFNSLAKFIMDCHKPSDEYLEKNKLSEWDCRFLSAILDEYLRRMKRTSDGHQTVDPSGDSIQYENDVYTHQVGIDHKGRLIVIATPKSRSNLLSAIRDEYIELNDAHHPSIRIEDPKNAYYEILHMLEYCGYMGLDSILIKKDVARNILEIITDYVNNIIINPVQLEYLHKNIIDELTKALSGHVDVLRDEDDQKTDQ